MSPDPTTLTGVELAQHSTWMRRLAQALLHDSASADDVVQAAWMAAIEQPPPQGRSLGPWLARVVRNLAGKHLRARHRREQRERVAARREALAGADDVVARLETAQQLVEAVRSLAEPFRRTLILRFFDELETAEIAARERVEAATVRWRIHRGLRLLRAELDRRSGGDRSVWSAALLPMTGKQAWTTATLGGATILPGALAVQVLTKAALAVSLIAVVSVGLILLRDEPSRPEALEAPAFAGAVQPASAPEIAHLGVGYAQQREPASGAVDEPARPTQSTAPALEPARLRARVVDDGRRPLAGARVTLLERSAEAVSDLEGRAEIALATEKPLAQARVRVALGGFATRWLAAELAPHEITTLGDIALERGATLRGRVLAPDGTAQPGAEVVVVGVDTFGPERRAVAHGPETDPGAPATVTDAFGAFSLEAVGSGPRRVWAKAAGTRWAWSAPLSIEPGELAEGLVLRLDAEATADSIEGIVVDPTGAPLPDARVSLEFRSATWNSSREIRVGADARFRVPIEGDAAHDLRARDVLGRWPEAVALGVLPGAREVALQFREARTLEIEARSRLGDPLDELTLTAQRADDATPIPLHDTVQLGSGRALIQTPVEPFVLVCAAAGYAPQQSDAFDLSTLPARWSVELDPQAGVSGVVVAGGAPIAGASVRLHATPEPGRCYELDEFPIRMRASVACEANTDAQGRFTLTPGDPGDYFLLVEAQGHAPEERGPLAISGAEGIADLVIELGQGGALEGRVLMPPGQSAEGVIVAANRGDTFARTVRAGEDGSFRFERLTPGEYQLVRAERVRAAKGHTMTVSRCENAEFRSDCRVALGRTERFDLDLRDARPCVVEGTLRWGGTPASGWIVSLWPHSGVVVGEPPATVTDARGSFTLSTPNPGRYGLQFAVPSQGGELMAPLDLERGITPFERSVETAVLSVRRSAPAGEAQELLYKSENDGRWFYASIPAAEALTLTCPAGHGEFGRHVEQPGAQLSTWVRVLEVTTTPGERRTVDLP